MTIIRPKSTPMTMEALLIFSGDFSIGNSASFRYKIIFAVALKLSGLLVFAKTLN